MRVTKSMALWAAFMGLYMLAAGLITGSVCFLQSTIGVPCPACGLTRAFLALANLNFREAFYWHPLFWLVPIVIAVWFLRNKGWFSRNKPKLIKAAWGVVFVLFAVFVVRMFLLFPHTEPLTFNTSSFLMRTVGFILGLFGFSIFP